MKKLLQQYATYNIWANDLMIAAMMQMPIGMAEMEMHSSFKTIKTTVIHMWSAEDTWLQRLRHVTDPVWAAAQFSGSFEEVCINWRMSSAAMADYIEELDEAAIAGDVHYKDLKGNSYTTPVAEIIQHVFNHATYHRGQLVTMMRTAGVTTIPGTDFIKFVRL